MARLTPKQTRLFLAVAEHWGHVFMVPFSYGFLIDHGLVRQPTRAEIDARYRALIEDAERTRCNLVEAARGGFYADAMRLAEHGLNVANEIKARDEDADRLACLSDAGIARVKKLREVK